MSRSSDGRSHRHRARAGARETGPERKGLAVEGPGFLVWDEVASAARQRAAELMEIARGAPTLPS